MSQVWAANSSVADDRLLEAVYTGLTVDMIMVPRANLMTCRETDTIAEVVARNSAHYSYIPIIDNRDRFTGLLHAERWFETPAPKTPVSEECQILDEAVLIGGKASIVDFVSEVDQRPCRLVVSGHRIDGLVSLSDLQQLPVRAALFTLITALELTMAEVVRVHFPNPEDWMELVSGEPRRKIKKDIERSKANDGFVEEIVFTKLRDKAEILIKTQALNQSLCKYQGRLDEIVDLRNNLAHADHYAQTPDDARKISAIVRSIIEIQHLLAAEVRSFRRSCGNNFLW